MKIFTPSSLPAYLPALGFLIFFKVNIAFSLIGTPAGRDVINYLAKTTDKGLFNPAFQILAIYFSVLLPSFFPDTFRKRKDHCAATCPNCRF